MRKTEKFYNISVINFESKKYYLLWYSDDIDGFVLDDNSEKLMKFKDIESVRNFVNEKKLNLYENIVESNYDKKELLNVDKIDCNLLLEFWNDITDLSKSLQIEFIGDDDTNEDINNIYSKLFHGNNLPAYIGDRKRLYVPKWTKKEKSIIKQIVSQGLEILESAL